MEPAIGRSLVEGFRAANKSWAGMGFFAGISILMLVLAIVGVMLASPPEELFQSPGAGPQQAVVPEGPATPADVAAPLNESATLETAEAPGEETQKADLFQDLATTEEAGVPAQPETALASTVPTPEEISREQAAERDQRNRVIGEWVGRVWPLLLIYAILLVVAWTWLYGGQIGYLAKRVTTSQAGVSEFWTTGSRALGALLGASLMSWLAVLGVALIVVLISFLFGGLAKAVPAWVVVILGILLGMAALAVIIWLTIRLSFWFIAIVADRLGPVASFKASFRVTRGRWWPLFGLCVLVVVISFAVRLPFGLLEWIGSLMGAGAALVFGILAAILEALANLYVGFVTLGAFIRFYEDAKSAPAGASPSAQP